MGGRQDDCALAKLIAASSAVADEQLADALDADEAVEELIQLRLVLQQGLHLLCGQRGVQHAGALVFDRDFERALSEQADQIRYLDSLGLSS